MPYDSLRPYLGVLEQKGLFRWIAAEVDKDWEIATIGRMIFRGLPEERIRFHTCYGVNFYGNGCDGARM